MEALRRYITRQIPELDNFVEMLKTHLDEDCRIIQVKECRIGFIRFLNDERFSANIVRGANIDKICRYGKYVLIGITGIFKNIYFYCGMIGKVEFVENLPDQLPDGFSAFFEIQRNGEKHGFLIFSYIEEMGYSQEIKDFIKRKDLGPDVIYTDTAVLAYHIYRRTESVYRENTIRTAIGLQTLVAGAEDYIIDEALYRSRIHPMAYTKDIRIDELITLVKFLKECITTDKEIKIFGKETCWNCLSRIRRHRLINKTLENLFKVTYYCPKCQYWDRPLAQNSQGLVQR